MEIEKQNTEISIQNVWKQRRVLDENRVIRDLTILSNVSVDFCGGCVQVIMGPSGSGKTTLLRLLNKLESPDKGQIYYKHLDLKKLASRQLRKEIGMVFQTPALFRGTIADNIAYGPQLYDKRLSRDRINHFLEIVGLINIDTCRDVGTLSIGQQQRVAFARALANGPRVLLLDEPTSALDPSSANNLLDLVRKINQELDLSIIMVSHVMEHAKRIADMIFLLVEGRMIESGESASFFDRPKTDLARRFIKGEL